MPIIPDDVRAKAEIFLGDAAGQEKTRLLLQETGLPSGLLPLRDIIECGYVEETRFVWLKQRRKVDHYFAKAGRHVTYAAEVSAHVDKGRLWKITGVKAKELLMWVGLTEIRVDERNAATLVCKAVGGFFRTFPVEAFRAADDGRRFVVPPKIQAAIDRGLEEDERKKKMVVVMGGGGGAAAVVDHDLEKEGEVDGVEKKAAAAAAAAAGEEEEGRKKKDDVAVAAGGGDGVGEVGEKLKEMSTNGGDKVVQAEAVAAKN